MARNFTNSTGSNISVNVAAKVLDQSQFSVLGWFRVSSFTTRAHWLFERADFNKQFFARLFDDSGVIKIESQYRTPSGIVNLSTAVEGNWDDGVWHWFHYRREGSTGFYLDVDGNNLDNDTSTSPGTDATALTSNYVYADLNGNESIQGDGARFMKITGGFLSSEEARGVAYGMKPSIQPLLYLECGYGSPEPDWSGNGYNGTVNGTTAIADHPPTMPLFGYDDYSSYEVAAASGRIMSSLTHHGGLAGHGGIAGIGGGLAG